MRYQLHRVDCGWTMRRLVWPLACDWDAPCDSCISVLVVPWWTRGSLAVSCRFSAGRQARRHYINDLMYRALIRVGVPATKEPKGLLRADGKRPDGLTLVHWLEGHSITWDVTIADTVAESYLANTSVTAGAAAEAAAERKTAKYIHCFVTSTYFLFRIRNEGQAFLRSICRRTTLITSDHREAAFMFQCLSLAVQRFN
jgi:hypothetical protein